MVAQSSTSAGITVSGQMNGVINMSSRSLKFRIDGCNWQTTQINMLIIEAVRGMQTCQELTHIIFAFVS